MYYLTAIVDTFVVPLLITLVVELAIAALSGLRGRRDLLAVALVNVVTNPPLNFLVTTVLYLVGAIGGPLALVGDAAFLPAVAFLEVVVVVVEWRLLIWALGRRSGRMLALAVVMNLASVSAGLALWVFDLTPGI